MINANSVITTKKPLNPPEPSWEHRVKPSLTLDDIDNIMFVMAHLIMTMNEFVSKVWLGNADST